MTSKMSREIATEKQSSSMGFKVGRMANNDVACISVVEDDRTSLTTAEPRRTNSSRDRSRRCPFNASISLVTEQMSKIKINREGYF